MTTRDIQPGDLYLTPNGHIVYRNPSSERLFLLHKNERHGVLLVDSDRELPPQERLASGATLDQIRSLFPLPGDQRVEAVRAFAAA